MPHTVELSLFVLFILSCPLLHWIFLAIIVNFHLNIFYLLVFKNTCQNEFFHRRDELAKLNDILDSQCIRLVVLLRMHFGLLEYA